MEHLIGILYFFLMVAIIVAAYFTSRFMAARSLGMTKGKYINLIDRIMLGKDKGILIIQIGEKIHLLSEGTQGFNSLCELCDADLVKVPQQNINTSFKNIINHYLVKKESVNMQNIKEANALSELKNRVADSLNSIKSKNSSGKE